MYYANMPTQDSGTAGQLKKGDHRIVISNWRLCDDNSLEIEIPLERFHNDKYKTDEIRIFDYEGALFWLREATKVELYNRRDITTSERTRCTIHSNDHETALVRFDDISRWDI